MANKTEIYNRFRKPPEIALKAIKGGRLKGMTDINPQWRLQVLTELFGPVGQGWYTEIINHSTMQAQDGTIVANVVINLYYRQDDEWSKPVTGVGGSMLVAKESSGLRTNDEAFKMAETDAISVACKKLGIAADIYWSHGSKYTVPAETQGSTNGQTSGHPDPNPMPDSFPTEPEMQKNYNDWVAAGHKFRKLETFNAFIRDNDKQIKHDLGGAGGPFVQDFGDWVKQRRAELSK